MRHAILLVAAILLLAAGADANGPNSGAPAVSSSIHRVSSSGHRSSRYCIACQRDSHGRIKRSPEAKRAFTKSSPCPSTGKTSGRCPGYVIDHVVPLKRGGADAPGNMQWQTKAAAKAKDKVE
jgi:hypothetical protein